MPPVSHAHPAIVDIEPVADALQTAMTRILMDTLPPWVDIKPYTTRQGIMAGARVIFHQALADLLAWTPRAKRSGNVVHCRWRYQVPEEEASPMGGEVDALVYELIHVLGLWRLGAPEASEEDRDFLNGITDALAKPLDELLIVIAERQLSHVIGPYVYHAWHARPLGTAYVLQAGGLMINPKQLMHQAAELGDLDQPMEVNLAEHWALAGQGVINPLDEAAVMTDGDMVSDDPLLVSAFICEDLRQHPHPEEMLAAHDTAKRRPGVPATVTKFTMINDVLKRHSSLYQGPVQVGPAMPEASSRVSKGISKRAVKRAMKDELGPSVVADRRRRRR